MASTLQRVNIEICILAGGLSKRMGRDKAQLRLGATTMLGHIRNIARATGRPVRVIRHDRISKCGPLGGIYTALETTKANAVLFLACDMPLVSVELIEFVLQKFGGANCKPQTAIFVDSRRAGFPFILRRGLLELVRQQIEKNDFSLQSLAKVLKATILRTASPLSRELLNVNTPADWAIARKRLANRHGPAGRPRGLHLA